MRSRLIHELEDSGVELERTRSELSALDKKCKKIDVIIIEWKGKYDTAASTIESLTLELQKSNVRTYSGFVTIYLKRRYLLHSTVAGQYELRINNLMLSMGGNIQFVGVHGTVKVDMKKVNENYVSLLPT